jgi:lactase-phlorizin hydrolase
MWITINEPFIVSNMGYGIGYDAPGKNGPGVNNYIVAHNLLKAHAKAYRVYEKKYAAHQGTDLPMNASLYNVL